MFSHQRGETITVSQRKTRLRIDAKREWPEVEPLDLAQVKTEWQLAELVRSRTGRSAEAATREVRHWMECHQMQPDIGVGFLARRPLAMEAR